MVRSAWRGHGLGSVAVYGMMPFENRIYELELTGAEIRDNIVYATNACGTIGPCSPAIAGMRYRSSEADPLEAHIDAAPRSE